MPTSTAPNRLLADDRDGDKTARRGNHPRPGERQVADEPGMRTVGDVHRTHIAAEDHVGAILDDDEEAQGRQHLRRRRRLDERRDRDVVKQRADDERCRDEDQGRDVGVDAEGAVERIACEHGRHGKMAMREIDDVHDAEDEGEADGEERVGRAHQQPARQHLQKRSCRQHSRRPRSTGRTP
jgi:hypothetical protein